MISIYNTALWNNALWNLIIHLGMMGFGNCLSAMRIECDLMYNITLAHQIQMAVFPYTTDVSGIWAEEWCMDFYIPLTLVVYGKFSHI